MQTEENILRTMLELYIVIIFTIIPYKVGTISIIDSKMI